MRILVVSLSVVLTILYGVYVYLLNDLGIKGRDLAAIDRQIVRVAQENQELKEKIAEAGSLRVIEEKAKALGFDQARIVTLPNIPH